MFVNTLYLMLFFCKSVSQPAAYLSPSLTYRSIYARRRHPFPISPTTVRGLFVLNHCHRLLHMWVSEWVRERERECLSVAVCINTKKWNKNKELIKWSSNRIQGHVIISLFFFQYFFYSRVKKCSRIFLRIHIFSFWFLFLLALLYSPNILMHWHIRGI